VRATKVIRLWQERLTYREIGKAVGVGPRTIRQDLEMLKAEGRIAGSIKDPGRPSRRRPAEVAEDYPPHGDDR
jgi:predicted ArsR family transcriptional regulator